jgi:hypothetical protein
MTAGRIAREVCWTNQEEFSPVDMIRIFPCPYIISQVKNNPVGGRSLDT